MNLVWQRAESGKKRCVTICLNSDVLSVNAPPPLKETEAGKNNFRIKPQAVMLLRPKASFQTFDVLKWSYAANQWKHLGLFANWLSSASWISTVISLWCFSKAEAYVPLPNHIMSPSTLYSCRYISFIAQPYWFC